MASKRKTNFKWFWENQYGRGLTKKAKAYLSRKLKEYHARKRKIKKLKRIKKVNYRTSIVFSYANKEGVDLDFRVWIVSDKKLNLSEVEMNRIFRKALKKAGFHKKAIQGIEALTVGYEVDEVVEDEVTSGWLYSFEFRKGKRKRFSYEGKL